MQPPQSGQKTSTELFMQQLFMQQLFMQLHHNCLCSPHHNCSPQLFMQPHHNCLCSPHHLCSPPKWRSRERQPPGGGSVRRSPLRNEQESGGLQPPRNVQGVWGCSRSQEDSCHVRRRNKTHKHKQFHENMNILSIRFIYQI